MNIKENRINILVRFSFILNILHKYLLIEYNCIDNPEIHIRLTNKMW